jgi:hypothetical protein
MKAYKVDGVYRVDRYEEAVQLAKAISLRERRYVTIQVGEPFLPTLILEEVLFDESQAVVSRR